MPYAKDNHPTRPQNFELFMNCLRFLEPTCRFDLDHIYLDYGAGMMWDTVLAHPDSGRKWDRDGYQVLCPRDWDRLDAATELLDIAALAVEIYQAQADLMKARK